MGLRLYDPVEPHEAAMLNALQLAYIGDTVWEMIVRGEMIHRGLSVHHMHSACVGYVNAHGQALFLRDITPLLDAEETDIVRRGRNAHAHHPSPKNQNPEDYAASTAFEALIGYLYLCGREERILELSRMILGGNRNG